MQIFKINGSSTCTVLFQTGTAWQPLFIKGVLLLL